MVNKNTLDYLLSLIDRLPTWGVMFANESTPVKVVSKQTVINILKKYIPQEIIPVNDKKITALCQNCGKPISIKYKDKVGM